MSADRDHRRIAQAQAAYRSPKVSVFLANIQFVFNGDQLAFVRTHHLKVTGSSRKWRWEMRRPLELRQSEHRLTVTVP